MGGGGGLAIFPFFAIFILSLNLACVSWNFHDFSCLLFFCLEFEHKSLRFSMIIVVRGSFSDGLVLGERGGRAHCFRSPNQARSLE